MKGGLRLTANPPYTVVSLTVVLFESRLFYNRSFFAGIVFD